MNVHEYDPVIDFDEAQDAAQLTGNGLVLNGVQSNGFGITPVHPDAFDFATLQSNGLPNDLSLATADQLATFASCMEPPPVLLNGIGDGNGDGNGNGSSSNGPKRSFLSISSFLSA